MELKGKVFIGKLSLPIKVPVSKSTYFILNLNQYRNAHYITLNNAKIAFKEKVTPLLKDLPCIENALFIYYVYPATKALSDVANYCSIGDKFFSDALVEAGKLPDDNYKFVPEVRYCFGEVDPKNPRIDVLIYTEPSKEPDQMKITLEQNEIEQAIRNYINDQMHIKDGMEIVIDLKATRGDAGMTANIDIVKSSDVPAQQAASAAPVQVAAPAPKAQTVRRASAAETVTAGSATPSSDEAQGQATDNKSAAASAAVEEDSAGTTSGSQAAEGGAEKQTVNEASPNQPAAAPKKLFAGLTSSRGITPATE